MLTKKLENAFNEQLRKELFSANLYLAAAAYCTYENYDGFANFFRVQVQEETFHAMKFFDFMSEKGNRVYIGQIEEPENEFESLQNLFEFTLKHEKVVTGSINELMDLAIEEHDHAAQSFLKWFIDEQVEEEASFEKILNDLKLVGNDGRGLLMLDRELAQRVFNPPVTQ